ncbi:ABC transporter substrate-binding protein [Actinopolymorpha alba]|uniref:ABC transporter substrate-binding protein n=1 Tax=Actinopolymorpha alba TaxID=533267 RepID=UPI00037400E1|nr:extracellular solute-binding protein [Actinopolymorpha alba]
MTNLISRRRFVHLAGAAVAAAPVLAGCSGGSSGGGGEGPITFWSGYSTTDSNDKSKKPEDFWISQAIRRFTKKTGIQVRVEALPADARMFTKIRTASLAHTGPDVANVWSGSYLLSIAPFLEPMRQYFDDREYDALSGWAAVTEGFDPKRSDRILGVPNGTDGAMVLLYNADLVEKAGVDASKWPQDFDSWIADLEKIKRSGVTPLTLGKFAYVFFTYDTWLAQAAGGPPGIGALNTGRNSFTDPAIVDATTKWLRLREFCAKGAPTTEDSQALQRLYNGRAAISVGGAAAIPQLRERLGKAAAVAKLPNVGPDGVDGGTVGGCGSAFIVSKDSQHKPEAVAFIKHLLSADEQKRYAATGESGPLVGRTDLRGVYADELVNQVQAWGVEPTNTFWPDNTFSAELVNELGTQAQLAWNGDIDAAEFLSRLNKKRDAIK